MDMQRADVTIHIDEDLGTDRRGVIIEKLRAVDGVVSVRNADQTKHLVVVEYNPEKTSSQALLGTVTGEQLHAELVGL